MARPKKNDPGIPAKERLKQAFWKELTDKPYAKITVGGIVARAGVNRNTFYYHYECLPDLASECLRTQLPRKLIEIVIAGSAETIAENPDALRAFELDQTLDRLTLAAGPHGSGELGEILRRNIAELWFEEFDIGRDDLTAIELMAVEFTTAGIVAMASTLSRDRLVEQLMEYVRSDFFKHASESTVAMLRAARERKYGADASMRCIGRRPSRSMGI